MSQKLNLKDAVNHVLCHSYSTMKALKSKLTKEILSDPNGERQLRDYLVSKRSWAKSGEDSGKTEPVIDFRSKKGAYRVKPVVISKAV